VKKRLLITGGAGFIGSHLAEFLVQEDYYVRVLDNFSTGKRVNLAGISGLDLVEGDIRDDVLLHQAMEGVDGVFHLAALVSVPQSICDPQLNFEINIRGTQSVFDAARDCGVHRVVFASSAAVYGDNDQLPLCEDADLAPMSPYALAKRFGEELGDLYSKLYGVDVCCFRFFNVFGPRQDPGSPYSGVITKFLNAIETGKRPVIFGDGTQTRDFVYVKDVAAALCMAMERIGDGYAIYNLGSGRETSVLALLEKVQAVCGTDVAPVKQGARSGDIFRSLASVQRLHDVLGFVCQYSFEQGLVETVRWFAEADGGGKEENSAGG